jgi:hypothetical protein
MKWEALLAGHLFDLEDLPVHFDTDPRVHGEGDDYWLSSPTLDHLCEVVQVQEAARALVARVNGAMRLHDNGFQGVKLGGRYRNETGEHVIVEAASAVARSKAGTITVVGGAAATRPTGPREYAQLGGTDPGAADVLLILSRGDLDWYDLFKVFEIVREDLGGEAVIIGRGWATKSDLTAFRGSANHPGVSGQAARHARQKRTIPKRTMTLRQGRAFIADLVRSWMRSRLPAAR